MKHIDDFIKFGSLKEDVQNEAYARWVFNYFRMPLICKADFRPFMKHKYLFCEYEGKKYRVTGASRMGDVLLTSNFDQEVGYKLRVDVDKCSNWSKG